MVDNINLESAKISNIFLEGTVDVILHDPQFKLSGISDKEQ